MGEAKSHHLHLLSEHRKQVLLKDPTCELLLESAIPINWCHTRHMGGTLQTFAEQSCTDEAAVVLPW